MILTGWGSASVLTNIAVFSSLTHASNAPSGQKNAHTPQRIQVFAFMSTTGTWTSLPFSVTAGFGLTEFFGHISAQMPQPLHKSRFRMMRSRLPKIFLSRRNSFALSCLDLLPIIGERLQ